MHLADLIETEREPVRTDFERDSCQHVGMSKKTRTAEAGKKLVASVQKEMQEPRLAESVREAGEEPTAHAA